MKQTLFSFFVFLFITATVPAMACNPGTPGCDDQNSSGDVWSNQWQNQSTDFDHMRDEYISHGSQQQGQCARGWGDAGFSGSVDLSQGEYQPYEFSADTSNGGSTHHFGEMIQHQYSWGEVSPDCDLGISTSQNQKGENHALQTGTHMSASNRGDAHASAKLGGAPDTTGTVMDQDQIHNYYQERPDGAWQGGTLETKTHLELGSPPSTP